uniref:CSON005888 protein n=1 Tax=Culicoides sonorensis TaxID=179676 RepID=A0A336LW59_CULSO
MSIASKKKSSLTLPPDVQGEYNGFLELKIDDIKWRGNKSFNLIIVKVKFWGQSSSQVGSIWFNYDGKKEPENLKYRIVTTSKLFKSYLEHSEPVQLRLVSSKTNNLIGSGSFNIPESVAELKPDTSGKIIGKGTSPIFSSKGFILGSVVWTIRIHLFHPLVVTEQLRDEIPVRDTMTITRKPISIPVEDEINDTFTMKRTSTRERDTFSEFVLNNVPSITSSDTYTTVSSLKDYSESQKQGIMNYLLGKNVPREIESSILKEICNISPATSLMDILTQENLSNHGLIDTTQRDDPKIASNKSKFLKDFDSIRFAVHGFLATKVGIKEIMKKFTSNNMTNFNLAIECQISSGPVKSTDNNTMYFLSRPLKQDDLIEKIKINKQNYRALNNPKQFFALNNVSLTFVLWIRDCNSKISYILGASRVPLGQLLKENLSYSAKTAIKLINSDITVGVISFHAELGCRKTVFGSMVSDLNENTQDKGDEETKKSENQSNNLNHNVENGQHMKSVSGKSVQGESRDDQNSSLTVKSMNGPKSEPDEVMSSLLYFGGVKDSKETQDLEIYLTYFDLFTNEQIKTNFSSGNVFNFLKVFPVFINDEFLNKMKHNYILVEVFKYTTQVATIKLPLHQFYIAFRDNDIKAHMSKAKLPVISIDGWNNLISTDGNQVFGQLQVLLAVGTEIQIENLKTSRGLATNGVSPQVNQSAPSNMKSTQTSKMLSNFIESLAGKLPDPNQKSPNMNGTQMRNTSDLLEMLQKALTERPNAENNVFSGAIPTPTPFNPPTSVTPTNTFKENKISSEELPGYIRIAVEIDCARKLPILRLSKKNHNKKSKGTKTSKQGGMDVEPSSYVTFEAVRGQIADEVKSHEGIVYSTHVIERNCDPVWQKTFEVSIPADILWNTEKNFILKIWRKSNQSETKPIPTPLQDAVIGFTAVNLRPFISGVPDISSWYNIIDFSGRTNGQIRVNVRLLSKIPGTNTFSNQSYVTSSTSGGRPNQSNTDPEFKIPSNTPLSIETDENDFTNQLGRALKRKFTELEEISQRLKARLFDVTADDTDENYDIDPDDEFERDLNTVVDSDDEERGRNGPDFAWLGQDRSMFSNITENDHERKDLTQQDKKELDTALKFGDIETSVNLFKSILASSETNDGAIPSTSQQNIGSLSQALKETSLSDDKRPRKGDEMSED